MLERLFRRDPSASPAHSTGNAPRWERLFPHPGFMLVDATGACVAYMHVRPDDDTVAEWKRRYPDHAHLIDEALDATFSLE